MIKLRNVEDKDLVHVAEFLARESPFSLEKGFPYTTKECWLSYFELWWNDNPAYTDQFPRGWILENDTSIVGFMGNIPIKFLIFGENKIAASANAWYVNPSFRGGSSLKLLNEFIKQKNPSLLLFKIEDESFVGMLSKYNFKHIILPASQIEYVYIIKKGNVRYIFPRFLSKILKPTDLSEVLEIYKRFGFLFYAYLHQRTSVEWGARFGQKYISSVCTRCDDSFSRLWDPYLNSDHILIARDTKTLNWLYFSRSRFSKRIVIQCHKSSDNKLVGYMVFDIQRINKTDPGIMQLMDICIGSDDPQIIASLTSYAIEIGKRNGASLLIVWGNNQKTETYFRSMFSMRIRAQHHRFIRFSDEYKTISARINFNNIYLTMIHPPQ